MREGSHPLAPVVAQIGRIATGATVRWVENAPEQRQRIYYANHTSHLDFVVLWSALPSYLREYVRPVAAADYWRTPLKRYMACKVFNAVLVQRSDHASDGEQHAARDTITKLIEGMGPQHSLIIFPEGTRGSGDHVASFKSGIYHLAKQRPEVELVPVYLSNLNRVLPKGEFLAVPVICSVTFGPPLRLAPEETKADFLGRAHEALCRLAPE